MGIAEIRGSLRRLDARVFPPKRQTGEPPEAFLRRAAESPLRATPGLREIKAALREHLALLEDERRSR